MTNADIQQDLNTGENWLIDITMTLTLKYFARVKYRSALEKTEGGHGPWKQWLCLTNEEADNGN